MEELAIILRSEWWRCIVEAHVSDYWENLQCTRLEFWLETIHAGLIKKEGSLSCYSYAEWFQIAAEAFSVMEQEWIDKGTHAPLISQRYEFLIKDAEKRLTRRKAERMKATNEFE